MHRFKCLPILLLCALAGCTEFSTPQRATTQPALPAHAPDLFRVELATTKGPIFLEVHRPWSPRAADRFYELVRTGYFDNSKFFRVRAGNFAQFGIAADPALAQSWRTRTFPDDPVPSPQISNTRGTVAFAFAVKDGRSTQIFINLRDNSATHDHPADGLTFLPFATVIQGMDHADALNAQYGENAGGGIRGGKQDPLFQGGNAYLDEHYPGLDAILQARLLP